MIRDFDFKFWRILKKWAIRESIKSETYCNGRIYEENIEGIECTANSVKENDA